MHVSKSTITTPIGLLQITATNKAITSIKPVDYMIEDTSGDKLSQGLIKRCKFELEEYFNGQRKTFNLPLKPNGTDFQKQVWKQLKLIPYGETRTYAEVAKMIGKPKAARAIGMANHNNPILILIPCHRVIGADGSLTGYAAGIESKEFLLNFERKNKFSVK